MEPGLYDQLLTRAIEAEIAQLGDPRLVAIAPVDSEESHSVLAQYLERLIASSLALHRGSDAAEKQRQLVERIVGTLTEVLNDHKSDGLSIATPLQRLLAIHRTVDATAKDRPDSPLSRSSLFTGTRLDASLGSQLRKEIATCDRVDILCSFIKWSGLRVLLDNLRELSERSAGDGPVIRVITTSYMGATDPKAIEVLRELPRTEVRVSYDTKRTRLWSALEKHPAERTLIFCCSRRHAMFVRDWLRLKGTTSAAVFSGTESDSYAESLHRLRTGALQSLCVVDMFNEGLDIPAVDRVVMLRPTESKVIFLQQLGRGLRASEGKAHLLVIDFVGNHRIFAQRLVHLLSLGSDSTGWELLRGWLNGTPPELPPGCLLDVELDAKDMLRQFLPQGATAGIEAYRAIRDELARKPTMLEMFVRGYLPRTISVAQGNWFAFAEHEGDLNDEEKAVVASRSDWFRALETASHRNAALQDYRLRRGAV